MLYFPSSVEDRRTGKRFAIKKFNRPFQSVVHARRTFRELDMLSQLKHDNVMFYCYLSFCDGLFCLHKKDSIYNSILLLSHVTV